MHIFNVFQIRESSLFFSQDFFLNIVFFFFVQFIGTIFYRDSSSDRRINFTFPEYQYRMDRPRGPRCPRGGTTGVFLYLVPKVFGRVGVQSHAKRRAPAHQPVAVVSNFMVARREIEARKLVEIGRSLFPRRRLAERAAARLCPDPGRRTQRPRSLQYLRATPST